MWSRCHPFRRHPERRAASGGPKSKDHAARLPGARSMTARRRLRAKVRRKLTITSATSARREDCHPEPFDFAMLRIATLRINEVEGPPKSPASLRPVLHVKPASKALKIAPSTLNEGCFLPTAPALQPLLEIDRIMNVLELGGVDQLQRPVVVGIALGIETLAVLPETALDVVSDPRVVRAVEAQEHVDEIRSHTTLIATNGSRGKGSRWQTVPRQDHFGRSTSARLRRAYAHDDKGRVALAMESLKRTFARNGALATTERAPDNRARLNVRPTIAAGYTSITTGTTMGRRLERA